MSQSNVLQRLNKHVINTGSKQVDLSSKGRVAMSNNLKSLGLMSVKQISAAVRDGVTYFTSLEGHYIIQYYTVCVSLSYMPKRELSSPAILSSRKTSRVYKIVHGFSKN